jgi:hypothetical protein
VARPRNTETGSKGNPQRSAPYPEKPRNEVFSLEIRSENFAAKNVKANHDSSFRVSRSFSPAGASNLMAPRANSGRGSPFSCPTPHPRQRPR